MHLIICTLKEGRVDSAEGLQAFTGKPCSKGNSVLLSNAHIKTPLWKSLCKHIHACTPAHSCMNPNDILVCLCFSNQCFGIVCRVSLCCCLSLVLLSSCRIKLDNTCSKERL